MTRVPLVLLTGFLGSGKTTLVNRLLARRAARGETQQLGVVVNELGEIGIDGALIGGASRQVELPGGCVCCVLGDDLDRTLIDLLDANPQLSAIVLETTGVAEPLPIAWALAREPVASRVRLSAVVSTVDAANFVASRSLSPAVDAQVAYADVVLVTKSDLVDPTAAVAEIRTLTSRALVQIRDTDEHAAWLETTLADPSLEHAAHSEGTEGHVHDEHCRHPDNASGHGAHGIDSVWVPVDGVVDLEELEDQLAELAPNYVRIKGIVCAVDGRDGRAHAGDPRWVVVHRVGPRVSSEPLDPATLEGAKRGRLVALGNRVDRDTLKACVDAAAL